MKKMWLNMGINALSLMVFMSMVSTGLLLEFVLPPGSGRTERFLGGGGFGRQKTIDLFLGLMRHEWGEIHFYLSLAFFVLLILHLILHWPWIQGIAWGTKAAPQSITRKLITIGIVAFVILVLSLPWIGRKETYSAMAGLKTSSVVSNITF